MRLRPVRRSITGLATFLVLVIAFDSSPSAPSVPSLHEPAPDSRALALVGELTGHGGGSARSSDRGVVRRGDLEAALGGRSQSFDLFGPGEAARAGAEQAAAEYEVVRKLPFGQAIARAAVRRGVDPLLVAALVETESAFAPDAVSSEGAIGLMQLLPGTGRQYGRVDLFDPYVNLEVGSQYLGALLERYHGDLTLALAAYNCGPATVTRYRAVPPYAETRDFVKEVLALYVQHRQAAWVASTSLLRSTKPTGGSAGTRALISPRFPIGVRAGDSVLQGR
jgi:Transglycosylase SLT domain